MTVSIVGSIAWFVVTTMTYIGLSGLFLLMAVESFGIPPLPSEVILPFAGFLVAEGVFGLDATIFVAVAGGLVGSFAAYAVGRWGRDWLTRRPLGPLRFDPKSMQRVDGWFARRGEVTVAVTRLIPVIRSYISYPAGFARMKPWKFGVYTLLGSIPFTLAFLYAGIRLQGSWTVIESYFTVLDYIFIAVVVAAAIYLLLVFTDQITWGWPPRRIHGSARAEEGSPPVERNA
ncbi:MAG: DedA family protein [Thermoplasmata archaeon]